MSEPLRTTIAPLYQCLANLTIARAHCQQSGNRNWVLRWNEQLATLSREFLPSGSGIDNGTTFEVDRSNGSQLVFHCSYHHMNDAGMYDGWTYHTIRCRAALWSPFELTVSGRNRNDIKDYLARTFHDALSASIEEAYDSSTDATTFRRLR